MSYKKTDALMRHLRNSGISIQGSKQKRQLINTGYFHGYKGYRFFGNAYRRLPFVSYDEVYATIRYDSDLKALLYEKMMFIETAVKNIALESILVNANSESIQDMYDKVVSGYNNAPVSATAEQKRKLQQNKLNLQKSIQYSLAYAYKKNNPKITHFYNNDDISKRLSLNVSCDTDRQLIYKYIYTLKDLRNAIAHNAVVFDTRFRNIDPTGAMKQCLKLEIGLPYVNFKTIGDYIILMCYYMKLLKVSRTEIKAFIRKFEKITYNYSQAVNLNVVAMVIHPDLTSRMNTLKSFI